MNVYPYTFVVTTNIIQGILPSVNTPVWVYISGTAVEKQLYADATGSDTSKINQPLYTDSLGRVTFFSPPGRIRVDAHLDSRTVYSTEDVITDQDSVMNLIMGETPSGVVDGSNTTFTVSNAILGDKVSLYVNGYRWKRIPNTSTLGTNQFKVTNNILTLGNAPGLNSVLLVDYYPLPEY